MAEIIKVYKEHQPALRFIGKRYTSADAADGGYGHKWGEWFQNDWFAPLEKLGEVKEIENGYIGFMRECSGMEYWIGMFLPSSTQAPEGYDFIDLDACNIGVCWIKAPEEDRSIFTMHNECIQKLKDNGMGEQLVEDSDKFFCFERYNCPRFTDKDEQGNIILDYGVYLA